LSRAATIDIKTVAPYLALHAMHALDPGLTFICCSSTQEDSLPLTSGIQNRTRVLTIIARPKDSGFEFRAAFTIVQHFHFFEKKI
jgi:hypothetical protein